MVSSRVNIWVQSLPKTWLLNVRIFLNTSCDGVFLPKASQEGGKNRCCDLRASRSFGAFSLLSITRYASPTIYQKLKWILNSSIYLGAWIPSNSHSSSVLSGPFSISLFRSYLSLSHTHPFLKSLLVSFPFLHLELCLKYLVFHFINDLSSRSRLRKEASSFRFFLFKRWIHGDRLRSTAMNFCRTENGIKEGSMIQDEFSFPRWERNIQTLLKSTTLIIDSSFDFQRTKDKCQDLHDKTKIAQNWQKEGGLRKLREQN